MVMDILETVSMSVSRGW